MFVFAFEDKGLMVSSAAKIRDNYRSGNFRLDVVSLSVYLDLATAVVGLEYLAIIRIPRWFPPPPFFWPFFFVEPSSRPSFVLTPFDPSTLRPFDPLTLRPFVPWTLLPFDPSTL